MEENNKTPQPKILEMAKKRRHIHLLEKMARGKSNTPALSRSEIEELGKYENDPNSPGIVDSQEKVAKIFKVAARTVARWAKDGMPITSQGKYDLFEIRAWKTLRNQKQDKKNKKKDIDWEERYREYKAKLAEIALKKAIGELIPKEIVEKELAQISLTVNRTMDLLAKQLAPQVKGLETRPIHALLTERFTEIKLLFNNGNIFAKILKENKNVKTNIDAENLD